mmetsp:Transcript_3486/g.9317  ORF Transcript_3486/g.9317 Transcript_3486/m.9317 type:complete len:210 (-) Transcript_3486:552-1181(-)
MIAIACTIAPHRLFTSQLGRLVPVELHCSLHRILGAKSTGVGRQCLLHVEHILCGNNASKLGEIDNTITIVICKINQLFHDVVGNAEVEHSIEHVLELLTVACSRIILVDESVRTADLAESCLEEAFNLPMPVHNILVLDLILDLHLLALIGCLLQLLLQRSILLELSLLLLCVRQLALEVTRSVQLWIREGLMKSLPAHFTRRSIYIA